MKPDVARSRRRLVQVLRNLVDEAHVLLVQRRQPRQYGVLKPIRRTLAGQEHWPSCREAALAPPEKEIPK